MHFDQFNAVENFPWAELEFSNDAEGFVTIRMFFDQFNAVEKEKLYFSTTHPIFSLVSPCTLSKEKYW